MSVGAITWAYRQKVRRPGAKFVLVTLANFADGDGFCYPGQMKLSALTAISERAVRAHLSYLEIDLRLIKREHRRGAAGKWTSDGYQLQAPADELNSSAPNGRQNLPPAKSAVGRNRPAAKSAANTKGNKDDTKDVSPARPAGSQSGARAPDAPPAEFSILTYLQFLSRQPAYDHIDPVVEESKVRLWRQRPANSRRRITERFLQSWVNRIERPLPERSVEHESDGRSSSGGRRDHAEAGGRELTREERIRADLLSVSQQVRYDGTPSPLDH